jgi:SAM-dependent methyltransferase
MSPDHEHTYLVQRGPDVRRTAIWSPYAHVARRLRELVADLVALAGIGPGDTVLDLGCADAPYRELLAGAEYLPADLPGNPAATVEIAADGTVPLPDSSVDLVLSTQVLEHVADPERYLEECVRLLRPGGHLLLSTHGIMHLHRDPTDYWRWTCDGLARIVGAAGLEVVETRGVLGLAGAGLQLLQSGLGHRIPRVLRRPFVAVFQLLIALTDRATSEEARRENGLVIAVLAVKPAVTP